MQPQGVAPLSMAELAHVEVNPARLGAIRHDAPLRTFEIDHESRRAQVVALPARLVRRVPGGPGARTFATSAAAIDRSATFTLSTASGRLLAQVQIPSGRWTEIAVELPQEAGEIELIEALEGTAGQLALWGDDRMIPRQRSGRPDVIVITLDTVRADYLSPYGAPPGDTPVLHQLAQESTTFDAAISTTSWTMPAHAALFTGRMSSLNLGFSERLEPELLTMAEVFAANGYDTFGVSGGPYTDSEFGFQQGFRAYRDSAEWKNAAAATKQAVDWIRASAGAPLFLFLNYFDAHQPLAGLTSEQVQALESGATPLTPAMLTRIKDGYRAEIRTIDRHLGQLLQALRQYRDYANTLLVIAADHGELLGDYGLLGHAFSLEEELIRVPLLVKAARSSPLARRVYREQFQLTDAFDLTMDLAGVGSSGGAIASKIARGAPVRTLTFAQVHHDPTPALLASRRWRSATLRAVRTDNLKVVRDAEGRVQTYKVDRLHESLIPATSLTARLVGELDRLGNASATPAGPPLVLPPDVRERLRALGYIR